MASTSSINASFDNLATKTINRWMRDNYADAFTSHHPILAKMLDKGKIVKGGAGYQWYEPFEYPDWVGPAVVGVTSGYQDLPEATETGGFTMAGFTPAQFAILFAVETYDINAQGSETERINHVGSVMDKSKKKFFEFFQSQLWGAEGAAGSNGIARDTLGSLRTYLNGGGVAPPASANPQPKTAQLTAAVGTTPLTTIGGVDRTVSGGAYWCPNLYNPTTAATPTMNLFNTLYTTCTRGTDHPDIVFVDEALYNFMMTTLQSQQRFTQGRLAELGFESFTWRGAEVVFDDGVPFADNQHQCFMLNMDYINLRYLSLQPQFELSLEPRKRTKQWVGEQTMQLTSSHLGRVHARHYRIANP